ncbi:MAG: NHL repeat-containing protein [Acidobacteriota bacterium]
MTSRTAAATSPATGGQVRLGAPAPGGLALPSGTPTASQLYAPRGVFLDEKVLAVADSGNHRILLWHGLPTEDGAPADAVLGQPTAESEGAHAGGRGPENGLHLPTGLAVLDGRLFVADAWHHRILVWDRVPDRSDAPPDWALGQSDLSSIEPNRGGAVSAATLYWPYGLGWVDGWFYVTDTGNRRVLAWRGLPERNRPADAVLGQPDFASSDENRGGPPSARSFRWPHAVVGVGGYLYVADAGDHRVLGWQGEPWDGSGDRDADLALGQADLVSANELPYAPQNASTLRFPYALATDGFGLAVADTANNRVLLWDRAPTSSGAPADRAIGQANFSGNGENRWQAVRQDTLCWPYGISLSGGRLAIADSGNNRVMIWELPAED